MHLRVVGALPWASGERESCVPTPRDDDDVYTSIHSLTRAMQRSPAGEMASEQARRGPGRKGVPETLVQHVLLARVCIARVVQLIAAQAHRVGPRQHRSPSGTTVISFSASPPDLRSRAAQVRACSPRPWPPAAATRSPRPHTTLQHCASEGTYLQAAFNSG